MSDRAERDYTYAVAYIRAQENRLFSQSTIDQILACRTYEEGLNFIREKGWGGTDAGNDLDTILATERNAAWEMVQSLNVPMDTFDVLALPNVYHNLKTAIKETYLDERHDDFFYEGTVPSREELREIVEKKEFGKLPPEMEKAAEEALETLIHTGDGQLCDVIIDRACLAAIEKTGQETHDDVIRRYAQIVVATTDIKIAVRCQKTGKSYDFMMRALQPTEMLDVEGLAKAATSGFDAILDYLSTGNFSEAAEALRQSPSEFERWCDDTLMVMLQAEKYELFTVGPLVAYILARETEIKTVGIILSGKANGLSDDSIRERVRVMYV